MLFAFFAQNLVTSLKKHNFECVCECAAIQRPSCGTQPLIEGETIREPYYMEPCHQTCK